MYDFPIALVTGASSPCGKAIVRQLAADYIVYGQYNTNDPTDPQDDANIHWVKASLDTEEDCKKLIDLIIKNHGSLQVLVNAIGPVEHTDVRNLSGDEWRSQLHLNLSVVFYTCQYAREHIEKTRKGHIINFSYAGAEHIKTQLDTLPYSIAKTGVVILSKTLAASMGPSGARCNVIAPGFIDSEIVREATRKRALNMVPMGRMASTKEIADTVLWILQSPRYISGAVINMAGALEFP